MNKNKIGDIKLNIQGDLQHGDCFFVVGPGFYGYGNSIKEARGNCIKSGCKPKMKMLAFYGDADIGVTGMGAIQANKCLVSLGEV